MFWFTLCLLLHSRPTLGLISALSQLPCTVDENFGLAISQTYSLQVPYFKQTRPLTYWQRILATTLIVRYRVTYSHCCRTLYKRHVCYSWQCHRPNRRQLYSAILANPWRISTTVLCLSRWR